MRGPYTGTRKARPVSPRGVSAMRCMRTLSAKMTRAGLRINENTVRESAHASGSQTALTRSADARLPSDVRHGDCVDDETSRVVGDVDLP